MAQQPPPPAPAGPPPDYFMAPPPTPATPDAPGFAMPPQQYQVPPPPYAPTGAGAFGTGAGILSQFTGSAAWAIGLGLLTIIVPFTLGRVFYVTPIVAFLAGIRAVRAGKVIGGIVGMVLSAIGGLITIVVLTTR